MKPFPLLAVAFTAALTITAHATVEAAPVAAPKAPPPGPVALAMTAMAQELSAASPSSMPLPQRLDALAHFQFSPATAARLRAIYGTTPPWTIQRVPAAGTGAGTAGAIGYRGILAPLHFKDADGGTVDWDALVLDIAAGADGRSASFSGAWPQLASTDKTLRVTVRDMKVAGQQQRSSDNLWFGHATVDIAGVVFEPVGSGPRMALEGIRAEQHALDQRQGIELGYQVSVRRIGVGGDGVDNFRFATRVTGIDRQMMLELQEYSESKARAASDPGASLEAKKAALMPLLKTMARGAVRSGTALEIDELGASFHGQALRANGRVGLEGAVAADADSPAALMKKLVASLHVKAPMALLREVSKTLAEVQVRAKNQGKADPQAVAQLAGSINDIALGKMVSSGMVRVDGDMLVSDIEYSAARGGLRVNGKAMTLPTVPAMPAFASASPQMMQARRIDERCALPDYPQDVIQADAPLSLTMRMLVKADGSVRNVVLVAPSNQPAYDQAVLKAAARCVYIPALRNGQPADAPVVWKVVREAGTSRP